MPDGRSMDYAIWRACERFRILPPNIKHKWDECNVISQADLLAYDQIRQLEEIKLVAALQRVS